MRIVVDYGASTHVRSFHLPSRHSVGGGETRSVPVVVIRAGAAANQDSASGGVSLDPASIGRTEQRRYKTTDEARIRDADVRGHERAHQIALGPYASSGIELTERRGANGEAIAVGGRIKVDLAPVYGDPEATLRKADTVRRAALAPGEPSAADMRIAAEAYRIAQNAEREISERRVDTIA